MSKSTEMLTSVFLYSLAASEHARLALHNSHDNLAELVEYTRNLTKCLAL